MQKRNTQILLLASALCCSFFTKAQTPDSTRYAGFPNPAHVQIGLAVNDILWRDAPATLPAGTRIAVLEGDPKKAAMFTMRVQLPANAVIRRHTHPREERVTVISGGLYLGFGAQPEHQKDRLYSAGSFYLNPPGLPHLLSTGDEPAIIQITGMGPWEIQYDEQK